MPLLVTFLDYLLSARPLWSLSYETRAVFQRGEVMVSPPPKKKKKKCSPQNLQYYFSISLQLRVSILLPYKSRSSLLRFSPKVLCDTRKVLKRPLVR